MVSVLVCQFELNVHDELFLAALLHLSNVSCDDALCFILKSRVSGHLSKKKWNILFRIVVLRTQDLTLSVHNLTTFDNSITTRSTHFNTGSFNWAICFLTIASNAMSGVNRPTRIPWMFRMANEISRRNSFSSQDILTISKRNLIGSVEQQRRSRWLSKWIWIVKESVKNVWYKPFVEQTINFCTARQFVRVDESWAGSLNCTLEVRL